MCVYIYIYIYIFNVITGINELKTLPKAISCKYECKFDGRKCNLNQIWNNNKYRYDCENWKKHNMSEKKFIWNPAKCS